MNQLTFDGITFDPVLDGKRLTRQFDFVLALMMDGRWRTLKEIAQTLEGVCPVSEAGVSARLRDFRKPRL